MNIGVFGDSFADKTWHADIWWQLLKTEYGHQVECFGECGSSILFSAQHINRLAKNYDLIIWALTTPGRFSLQDKTKTVHVKHSQDACSSSDLCVQKQIDICRDYLVHVFDWEQENFVGESIAFHLQEKYKNIMILPCFPAPLSAEFNLYQLCEREAQEYFPNKSIPDIYLEYQDLRPGHLTTDNQRILAKLINEKLQPGIFQTDYSNFVKSGQPIEQCFLKLKNDSLR
jgi:hypothetical protein